MQQIRGHKQQFGYRIFVGYDHFGGCKDSGKRYLVEFEEGNTEPTETVKSTDASAEFILEGNHLLWNDLMEQHHDPMLFGRM